MSNSQRSVNRIVESLIMRALWQLDFDCILFVYTRILTDFAVVIYCCSHSRTFSCLKTKSAGIKRAIKMVFNSWKTETSGAWTTDGSRRVCVFGIALCQLVQLSSWSHMFLFLTVNMKCAFLFVILYSLWLAFGHETMWPLGARHE